MRSFTRHPTVSRRAAGLLLAACLCCGAVVVAAEPLIPDAGLSRLRAERRAAAKQRMAVREKADAPARFGLLVVPVEFADTRFASDFDPLRDIAPLLDGSGEATLRRYFAVASGGKFDLGILLAPVVTLGKTRQEYSDLGSTNFLRTRMMATETLTAVRDLGLEFRLLDRDGPDGLPGSGDDDGQVDGVLLLHAGIGTENDPENGLIPAHQYYLTEPVVDAGVEAAFYAVASGRSGLGIWAHETAHLLGMEDRYDPRLVPEGGSEVLSRGGLGRFSLMSSGAWGTGDAGDPALPDAYSCLQLGWLAPRLLDPRGAADETLLPGLESGEAAWIWKNGERDTEFYLVETRDPAATAPFDAGVPSGQLIVYHIDESRPEGYLIPDDAGYHLRARVVEADGNDSLAAGLDGGSAADLFPGTTDATEFSALTDPSSDGYSGPSGVALTRIAAVAGAVTMRSFALASFAVDCALQPVIADPVTIDLRVVERGIALEQPLATVTVVAEPAWGSFADSARELDLALGEIADGVWEPLSPVVWEPDQDVPAGAVTHFTVRIADAAGDSGVLERPWVWSPDSAALDFGAVWPGSWSETRPGPNRKTGWFRWEAAPWLTATQTPVLACVDTIFPDSSQWPLVRYNNFGVATLTSGPLSTGLRGVRLVHAMESDLLTGDVALDGGRVSWIAPDGSEVVLPPVDGWEATVASRAYSPFAGEGVLTGTLPFLRDEFPVWQTDVIPAPDPARGPWRLRLTFASDGAGYGRGWYLATIDPIYGEPAVSAFPVEIDSGALRWTWPFTASAQDSFAVEIHDRETAEWIPAAVGLFAAGGADGEFTLSLADLVAGLAAHPHERTLLRVAGEAKYGLLASRPYAFYPDSGARPAGLLGAPWPNPSRDGAVRFLAEIPVGKRATVTVYDPRGRRLRSWSLPTGQHFLLWKGTDAAGRRVASGTYFLRIEGDGSPRTRKVVLLH